MNRQITAFSPTDYDEKIGRTLPHYNVIIQQTIEVVTFEAGDRELSWLDIDALGRWRNYQLSQGRTLGEAKKHLSRFGTAFYPINIEKQIQLLKETGFQSVEIFWLTYMQAGFWAKK